MTSQPEMVIRPEYEVGQLGGQRRATHGAHDQRTPGGLDRAAGHVDAAAGRAPAGQAVVVAQRAVGELDLTATDVEPATREARPVAAEGRAPEGHAAAVDVEPSAAAGSVVPDDRALDAH